MKKLFVLYFLVLLLFLDKNMGYGQIYLEDFGTSSTVTLPYILGTNPTGLAFKNANITNPSWTQSLASANLVGRTGGCISATIPTSGGLDVITCTFSVGSGYKLTPTSISYNYRISSAGPQKLDVSVSGTGGTSSITQVTTNRSGSYVGVTTSNFNSSPDLTGTITLVITLSSTTNTNSTCRVDDITLNGSVVSISSPLVLIAPTTLTGFVYVTGTGPSAEKMFTVSGSNLSTNNISINAPTNYEISTTTGTGFSSLVTLIPISGSVASTTIFVRLKAGLPIASYNENITCSNVLVADQTVSCSGSVTLPITSIWSNPITGTSIATNPYTDGQIVDPNVTVSGIGATGVSINTATDRFNFSGWNDPSINTGKYFEFTITPNAGIIIDFYNFSFTTQVSGTGPTNFSVRSSIDSYTSDIVTWVATVGAITVDLSAYKNITTTTTIRIYGWAASAGGGTFSINDFNFNNDKPLPVNLTSFNSNVYLNTVNLRWTTESEINNSGFEVYRDNIKIGFVTGKNTASTYTFSDANLQTGAYNYKLKQIDYNGNFEYFNLMGGVVISTPQKFEVTQNYPNPFNPVTKFSYSIPFDTKVTIKIFDITGREVLSQIESKPAGYHSFTFNAQNLSSGIYFYKIDAGQFSKIKKMILIK